MVKAIIGLKKPDLVSQQILPYILNYMLHVALKPRPREK